MKYFDINYFTDSAGLTFVQLFGKINIEESTKLYELFTRLEEQHTDKVILDFREVTFIDSSCLSIVMGFSSRQKRKGYWVAIFGCQSDVGSILEIGGVGSIIPIFDTVEELKIALL